jgi:hypothetical protein
MSHNTNNYRGSHPPYTLTGQQNVGLNSIYSLPTLLPFTYPSTLPRSLASSDPSRSFQRSPAPSPPSPHQRKKSVRFRSQEADQTHPISHMSSPYSRDNPIERTYGYQGSQAANATSSGHIGEQTPIFNTMTSHVSSQRSLGNTLVPPTVLAAQPSQDMSHEVIRADVSGVANPTYNTLLGDQTPVYNTVTSYVSSQDSRDSTFFSPTVDTAMLSMDTIYMNNPSNLFTQVDVDEEYSSKLINIDDNIDELELFQYYDTVPIAQAKKSTHAQTLSMGKPLLM